MTNDNNVFFLDIGIAMYGIEKITKPQKNILERFAIIWTPKEGKIFSARHFNFELLHALFVSELVDTPPVPQILTVNSRS